MCKKTYNNYWHRQYFYGIYNIRLVEVEQKIDRTGVRYPTPPPNLDSPDLGGEIGSTGIV